MTGERAVQLDAERARLAAELEERGKGHLDDGTRARLADLEARTVALAKSGADKDNSLQVLYRTMLHCAALYCTGSLHLRVSLAARCRRCREAVRATCAARVAREAGVASGLLCTQRGTFC